MYMSFRRVRGLGYMTVSEMLETMHENYLFDIFPEFFKVVHIRAVIPVPWGNNVSAAYDCTY